MNCPNALEQYMALDKHERVPFSVTMHLVFCPTCRSIVRKMAAAEKLLSRSFALRPSYGTVSNDPVVLSALEKITTSGLSYPVRESVAKRVSLVRWLLVGILLTAGFAVFPFTTSGVWMEAEFGNAFVVPFYILGGCAITAYGGLIIGTNIDLFIKRFKTLKA